VALQPFITKEQDADLVKTMALHPHAKIAIPLMTPEKFEEITTEMKKIQEENKNG